MIPSIKEELLKYGENTSIRGLPKVFKSKDIFLKLLWFLFFLASTAVLIYLLIVLFTKYYSWPMTTKYGEKIGHSLLFPDITICNLDPFAEGEPKELAVDLYFNFLETFKNAIVKSAITTSNSSDAEKLFLSKLFASVFDELNSVTGYIINLMKNHAESVDCPSLVVDCSFFGVDWFESNSVCSVANFSRIWNANYYTCYTLQANKFINRKEDVIRGLNLLLNVGPPNLMQMPYKSTLTNSQARGVRISVHSPGTPPDPKRGFNVAPGTENIVEIVQTEITRLGKPHNKLGCNEGKLMPNLSMVNYKQDLCLEYCQQDLVRGECGCMTHLLNIPEKYYNNVSLCGNLSIYNKVDFSQYFQNIIDSTTNFICSLVTTYTGGFECQAKCLQSCNETIYDTYISSATWPQPSIQLDIFKKYILKQCASYHKVTSRYASYFNYYYQKLNNTVINVTLSNLTKIPESFLGIKFVIKQNFPYYRSDNPAYTWDVMIGTVGGMLSLWLGITVASGVEIIELVYLLFKCCWQRNKSAPKSLIKDTSKDVVASQPTENDTPSIKHFRTEF